MPEDNRKEEQENSVILSRKSATMSKDYFTQILRSILYFAALAMSISYS